MKVYAVYNGQQLVASVPADVVVFGQPALSFEVKDEVTAFFKESQWTHFCLIGDTDRPEPLVDAIIAQESGGNEIRSEKDVEGIDHDVSIFLANKHTFATLVRSMRRYVKPANDHDFGWSRPDLNVDIVKDFFRVGKPFAYLLCEHMGQDPLSTEIIDPE